MGYIKKKEGPKQEIAYQRIKAGIMNHEFAADTMLIEGKLCELLGYSKTPIREALRRLASEGFVEFFPERGTFVSGTSRDEYPEMFDVLEALEGMAVRLCAEKRDMRLISRLNDIIIGMQNELIDGADNKKGSRDLEFQRAVLSGSMNSKLIAFAENVLGRMGRFEPFSTDNPEMYKLTCEEHKRTFEAINNGNVELAEVLMREHIRSIKEYRTGRSGTSR